MLVGMLGAVVLWLGTQRPVGCHHAAGASVRVFAVGIIGVVSGIVGARTASGTIGTASSHSLALLLLSSAWLVFLIPALMPSASHITARLGRIIARRRIEVPPGGRPHV